MQKSRTLLVLSTLAVLVLISGLVLVWLHPWQPSSADATNGQLPLHTVDDVNKVLMLTPTRGWAVADGNLWKTADGGKNWYRIVTDHPGTHFTFQSPTMAAYDFSAANTNSPAGFSYTADGGLHWQNTRIDNDEPEAYFTNFYRLSFTDARHGFYFTIKTTREQDTPDIYDYTLWYTRDAGQSWQTIASGPYKAASTFVINAASFANAQTGWAMDFRHNSFYTTNDGGQSWHPLAATFTPALPAPLDLNHPLGATGENIEPGAGYTSLDGPAISGSTSFPSYLHFFTTRDGMLLMSHFPITSFFSADQSTISDHISIYCTHDGGLHWQQTGTLDQQMRHSQTNPTWGVIDGQSLWYQPLSNHTRQIMISHDGGQHWQKITARIPSVYLRVINFVSAQVGWAYGYDQTVGTSMDTPIRLLQTNDGGQSWHEVAHSTPPDQQP